MPRISDDQIERIKQEVSLLRLAESQGYTPKKHGKDYAVCCPFHEEKTPSCIISPKSALKITCLTALVVVRVVR